jgi:hypothetical protein
MLITELDTTPFLFVYLQTLKIAYLSISKYLDTFARKVSEKPGER